MSIKLIIGLGNPGLDYEKTRHNAGKWFINDLVKCYPASFKIVKKMQAQIADLNVDQFSCRVALPLTFMNHSGQVARALSQFYQLKPEELLIAHDELDLPPGCVRLKTGGGHGGHNGLKDIINLLGSSMFHRLRLGIGHPGARDLVHQYVLSKASIGDKERIHAAIARSIDILPWILSDELARAMNQLNCRD